MFLIELSFIAMFACFDQPRDQGDARSPLGDSVLGSVDAEPAELKGELVFPLDSQHNHAPGIVELPNGDWLVSWYRGSGERKADDVQVLGSRRKFGESNWSGPFVMADTPGFPDCNTCMTLDRKGRLWLFWPLIIANSWESCLTFGAVSTQFEGPDAPKWDQQSLILLKPDDFSQELLARSERFLVEQKIELTEAQSKEVESIRAVAKEKLYQRLGWQPRCKPTWLKSGRMLLPLYSDTFSISIMAISDDNGQTWRASEPLIGFGNIQPAVLERNDGRLIALMRENGVTGRIRACESIDHGEHWGEVYSTELPNPGSGLDALRLENGHWLLIYNDTQNGRQSLAVSLSEDEGATWKWTRHLENREGCSFHYPSIVQSRNGTVHAVYSYFVPEGKSMKHVEFTEAWVRGE